jgi:membrane protein
MNRDEAAREANTGIAASTSEAGTTSAASTSGASSGEASTSGASSGEASTGGERHTGAPDAAGRAADRSWLGAVQRTMREFKSDQLTDKAAALTYYAVLAIFPGLLFLVSLLGLLGQRATQPLITNLASALPGSIRHTVLSAVTRLQHGHTAAGLLAIVAMAAALWSASSYIAAFMRAANAIYDVPEGRPAWKTMPLRLVITLVLMVLLIAAAMIIVVTGSIARHVGHVLGIGSAAITTWDIAKWPVLVLLVLLMLAVLYWASPNAKQGFRWLSLGAGIAVIGWLAASGLFAVYVANFGHYNKVYGSIAAVIILLVWLWISNLAVLVGAEFNAELERGRAMAAGAPADAEPFVELRDTTKLRRKSRKSRTSGPGGTAGSGVK